MPARVRAVAALAVPILVVLGALGVVLARDGGPATPDERADALARQLRCPECTSQSVADSAASTARDMRAEVERRIEAGDTDAQIREAFVERYGEWVLLEPARDGLGLLVWGLPVLVLGGGAVALAVTLGRRGRRAPVPSEADIALVERARGDGSPR